jgi:hypothetical protein
MINIWKQNYIISKLKLKSSTSKCIIGIERKAIKVDKEIPRKDDLDASHISSAWFDNYTSWIFHFISYSFNLVSGQKDINNKIETRI